MDLGAQSTISSFNIHFENPKDGNALQRVRKFKIEGSLNGSSYALIHNSVDKPEGFGVDEDGFKEAMEVQRKKARSARTVSLRKINSRKIT